MTQTLMVKGLYVLLTTAIFLVCRYVSWWLTERRWSRQVPQWLDTYPFICNKCLSTQSMLFCYTVAIYLTNSWFVAIMGAVLTIGNALSYLIKERDMLTQEKQGKQ